jgi:hypothetical protein
VMRRRRRIANHATLLLRSTYDLRRAAQRVAGICEWVVFCVEGSPPTGEASLGPTPPNGEDIRISIGDKYDSSDL